MAAMVGCYPASRIPEEDLWCLAYGTACDAKDVTVEIATQTGSFLHVLKMFYSVVGTMLSLRWHFDRLIDRQSRLILRLETSAPGTWSHADCAKMAQLLDNLIREENRMLALAGNVSPLAKACWGRSLADLDVQLKQLSTLAQYMDELSISEKNMPGDDDCREFLKQFDLPEEHDFSSEQTYRKALSQA